MKNVMTRAWKIAKSAVVKFGGSAIEYFAEALRMAWKEIKQGGVTLLEKLGFHNVGKKQDMFHFIVNSDVQVFQVRVNKDPYGNNYDIKKELEAIATGKSNKTGMDIRMYRFDVCSAYEYEIALDKESARFKLDNKGQLVWL
ncbi:hypothetical protein [Paenibacillus alvei]|uniref:hypothetical protein n=1 Tax=Paenibacillus alvei TaxID=44250 RepID=UPI000287B272|nr:hypothetical protein [Paenibacillus alvei]EJW14744.1 putative phage protein [Paenibacillus alvei DSM 29]MCY9540940.1 hypothetical protein [Paenibacillus alvei]MCY9708156.1 hypothetical protein [Paenibacillus alvei]MEC0080211.1 hypothetical protein [Paenibacillus alvei]NEZ43330.1 hypothetical protein [Paenibacillus alvei]